MTIHITGEVGPTGGRVIVKTAHDDDGRSRLLAEAHLLAMARHPGVVSVDSLDEDDESTRLVLVHAGDRHLGTHRPRDAAEVAGLVAAIAEILADLHARRVAHARLSLDHVLLAGHDRPVLCGLSGAVLDADEAACAADVAALAQMGSLLLERSDRQPRSRRRALAHLASRRRRALVRLLGDATGAGTRPGPTAADVARRAAELAGGDGPRQPAPPELGVPPDDTRPWPLRRVEPPAAGAPAGSIRPRWRRWASGAAVALTAAVLVGWLTGPGGRPSAPPEPPVAAPPPAPTAPTAPEPAAVATPASFDPLPAATPEPASETVVCPHRPAPRADLDGDGCMDTIRLVHNVVTGGGVVLVVGEPGDDVRLGDWNCDGQSTAALHRPTSGAVFVFDGWPDWSSSATAGTLVARLEPGSRLTVSSGEACDDLGVVDARGHHRILEGP